MKMQPISRMALLASIAGLCGPALAGPVNIRPVSVSGTALQTAMDGITVSGPGVDVFADQDTTAWFTNTASGGSITTFIVDSNVSQRIGAFGIYEVANPSNRATIFDGTVVQGDQALVSFFADGTIKVNGNVVASGFDDPMTFGYFLEVLGEDPPGLGEGGIAPVDYTVYTDDALNNLVNPSGDARVLVFRGDDQTVLQLPSLGPGLFMDNEFILAFETGSPDSGAKDFSDFVLIVESVAPIPEPATGLLLALGLGAIGRRRMNRS